MLTLKENPTLKEYQKYVQALEIERGFQDEDMLKKCLLLGEEIGELFGAVIKSNESADNIKGSVGEELSDIIILICAIANRFDIDMEKNFKDNGEYNVTLSTIQRHILISKKEIKHKEQNIFKDCLTLGEMVGGLHKAIRKQRKIIKIDYNSEFFSAQEILTKLIITLCKIANCYDINLEQSFKDKEKINKSRKWKV